MNNFSVPTLDITWQEAAKRWQEGQTVFSAELGGISPGYEQCIQILLFEILARWKGEVPPPNGEAYPGIYNDHVKAVAKELDPKLGFSGAQVGVAKATAYQFMHYGYRYMMEKLPTDRLIQVSKDFPQMD
jgi:hypothetical protein